jgi:hypothetical protein
MKPSREDLKRDLRIDIPDDAEILYGDAPPNDPAFEPWAWCKDKYQVFIKTPVGKIVILYIALTGFVPLPTPYEVIVAAYPYALKAMEIAWNDLRSQKPVDQKAYLAVLPPQQQMRSNSMSIKWGSLTSGTSVVTVSGLALQAGKRGTG